MKCIAIFGCLVVAVTFSACGGTDSPDGPDFERELGPGEYQVSVTGDVQRSFETAGGRYIDEPHFPGLEQWTLALWDDTDLLNGAQFDICATAQQGAYPFHVMTQWTGCPSDPSRANGGFIVQLGFPQGFVLDCYPNGAGDKNFEGVLTISSTDSDVRGEAQGNGTCSVHQWIDFVGPMRQATVSVRIRFRAVRSTS